MNNLIKKTVKVKVCGLALHENILEIGRLEPHFMGFIFYRSSQRYIKGLEPQTLEMLSPSILKTGVFVNQSIEEIEKAVRDFKLDAIQLHGNESPQVCDRFLQKGLTVIKAFGVDTHFSFSSTQAYAHYVSCFLFDTKTRSYGGSGLSFDHTLLKSYQGFIPYFLSGGLDERSALNAITLIDDNRLYAIDINSRFETTPGVKNISKVRRLINTINLNAKNDNNELSR